jgi:hypothetical protein
VKGTLVVTSAVYMRQVPYAPDVSYQLAVRAAGTFDALVCRRPAEWKDHFE